MFSVKQTKAVYDFVPYKYGCYSFSANADLTARVYKRLLAKSQRHFEKLDKTDYLKLIKPDDLKGLQQVKAAYGAMGSK